LSITSRHNCGGRGGFTLLETLVALLLLSILAAALYGSYFSVIRARESAGAGNEARRELRATLDQLRREIGGALYRTSDAGTPAYRKLRFVVEDRDMFGKPASTLEMTMTVPPGTGPADLPASDVAAVKYSVREKDGRLSLVREARDLYADLKPVPFPQMDELTAFLVECWSAGKWVRSWNADPSLNNRLPERVRITITIRDGDGTADFSAIVDPRVSLQ
jgi:general secretion pathway protein J